tara:strand:+ start:1250 stop:2227 length:978 start_codon:yes stop_codon:yes gene_type:complete
MHKDKKINICQISLARDIPIILENYRFFKKFYTSFEITIICPNKEILEFKKKLNFKEFIIINEENIISFEEFSNIFEELSNGVEYQYLFRKRLNWYYQQILKLSHVLSFVKQKKENIIIWDADTIILNKINFFKGELSVKYGTLFEFHKAYYITNKSIIGDCPKYFISSLVQFIGLSVSEYDFLINNIVDFDIFETKETISFQLSKIILRNIFSIHKMYNGSLFSEYELIGISNYMFRKSKQKAIFTLRGDLDGILSNSQILIARIFNVKHVTYEHTYPNLNSKGMLGRKQQWLKFIKILFKEFVKFNLRNLRHNFNYYYKYSSK